MGLTPTIVAIGGGGWHMEDDPRQDNYLVELAKKRSGKERIKVCLLPTPSDNADRVELFFRQMYTDKFDARITVLSLYNRKPEQRDIRSLLLSQDLIYVCGGNPAAAIAIWKIHGVDKVLHECWQEGVLLAGMSAGSVCWFETASTDSIYGRPLQPYNMLGFLPGSFAPHYDGEKDRREDFRHRIEFGEIKPGYAADDGVACRFEGDKFVEAVTSRPNTSAYHVALSKGLAVETKLETRMLDPC